MPSVGVTDDRPKLLAPRPLSKALGAEIRDVDLSRLLSAELHEEILEALLTHHLLIFRQQRLSDADVQRFAETLGEIEGHVFRDAEGHTHGAVHTISNLDAEGKPAEAPFLNGNYYWHSDKAYLPTPSWITMLYGLEIPPNGGDTQFANTALAYEGLSPSMKSKIDGLKVVNSYAHLFKTLGRQLSEDVLAKTPPVEHPLVSVHPKTGARSLFLSSYNERIVGMPEAEGRALLDSLLDHATQDTFLFTQKWKLRDFVFWDNHSLIHRAIANYEMGAHRRILKRAVVKGPRPAAGAGLLDA
jgi:taurine dioxygenase